MKLFNKFASFLAFAALLTVPATAQTNSLTATSITSAMTATQNFAVVNSATNILAGYALYIDGELMGVAKSYNGTATVVPVSRYNGKVAAHVSGAVVLSGKPNWFKSYTPTGACTLANTDTAPWINTVTGDSFRCYAGQWGVVGQFFVSPRQCTFAPTTLTQTTTWPVLGVGATVGVPVINSVTNAAAGTDTISCFILPPAEAGGGRSGLLTDLTFTLGSQIVAPTSLGTPLFGALQLPTPVATTQTMSSQTLTTLLGGTITQLGPTTSLTTVTTAGDFLTFNYSFASPVDLSTDLRVLVFQLPILQSAASAMTINSMGIFAHTLKRAR